MRCLFLLRTGYNKRSRPVGPVKGVEVIILGVILLILGLVFSINILWWIGIVLIVVGAIFALLGATGRAVGGRKYWY